MNRNQMIIEQVSPYNVPVTVEKLVEAAIKMEWQTPAIHNLQQSLAKSGKEVRPVQIVEICKPKFSGRLLEMNHERIISIMMPCRISVYEKEDGKTYVALLNISALSEGQPPIVNEVMQGATDESYEIVKAVVGTF